jgi:aspartate aminotransferase-like enzyme
LQPQSQRLGSETLYNVLAPGPVNLHPKVLEALALPMIHHRTPEFDAILARTLKGLRSVFQTGQDCFILSSTGSGGMEALLVNVLHPKAQVLGIDSGKFGERWCEMAKVFGAEVITHKVEWGKACQVPDVEKQLVAHPEIQIVMTQACETSTGVAHPIEALGKMIHEKFPQVLFLVDGITALGAYPLKMDEWHLDGVVGGSQKAFMLPTGLSFVSFSQKAWKKIENNPTPRYYFDLRREREANRKGETFFSSNVSLIRALDLVLQLIEEKGLNAHFAEIAERAEWTREMGERLGFGLFADTPSPSVTALTVPMGLDGQKIRSELEIRHHITVMGGQDQAKGKIIRIGHMGYIQKQDLEDLESGLSDVIDVLQTMKARGS